MDQAECSGIVWTLRGFIKLKRHLNRSSHRTSSLQVDDPELPNSRASWVEHIMLEQFYVTATEVYAEPAPMKHLISQLNRKSHSAAVSVAEPTP